jgi:hypothetical protein
MMKNYAHKVGAIFYILWGLLHIAGGAALLQQLSAEGVTGALASLGSAVPSAELPSISGGVVAAVLAFFAWNWLWIGLLVLVVGVTLNWKNNRLGYWLNLAVVSAADLGLIITLLIPGYMAVVDGMPGIVLWIPAAVFSTVGLVSDRAKQVGQAATA